MVVTGIKISSIFSVPIRHHLLRIAGRGKVAFVHFWRDDQKAQFNLEPIDLDIRLMPRVLGHPGVWVPQVVSYC